MKKLLSLLLVAVLALSLFACAAKETPAASDPTPPVSDAAAPDDAAEPDAPEVLPAGVQAIKDRGVFRVGVKVDVPKYGFQNPDTGEQEGLEADLARAIAKKIIGDENAVEFTAVTAQTRGPLLDNNEVDAIIATFTITEERKLSYNFTTAYFQDAIGFLVKKDLGATKISDLDGKTVGVAQSATTKAAIEEKAAELGIKISFLEFGSYPEINAALMSGRVDAFSVDKSILLGYIGDDTEIIDETFKPQEYGIATKLANTDLAAYLEDYITTSLGDGTLDALISEWGLDK
ncbi:MAG: transporter substrate-binding domain-containing protein [Oscillospiraceae bacterium]|jgi:putative glutamine transport system substrate-binding protein|nr:transporter substrate-binding domain-containing protein [Oscillospiraceae bacterium]